MADPVTFADRVRRHRRTLWLSLMVFTAVAVLLFLNIYLSIATPRRRPFQQSRIQLGYAEYIGVKLDNGVNQYLGMRYAAPPLGSLRWRKPREPEVETLVQDANSWPTICLGTNHGRYPGGQGEDCLFVNVWAPTVASNATKLPVWVFIQGGGYTSNSNANWNGSDVVEKSSQSIVFVNFNYRVGLWGFLAGKDVARDGDLNVGLHDQRQLLKWVKKHISKFGGDPDRVVIHGLSAGAGSVALHLTAHGGRDDGLFAGAISQSVFFPAQPRVPELEYQFNRTLDIAGCNDAQDRMACLRSKDQATLQDANTAAAFPGRAGGALFYFTPCIDGDLLQDYPYVLYDKGAFVKVPVLFGATNDEGSVFAANAATQEQFKSWFQDQYPTLGDADAQTMLGHYPSMDAVPQHSAWFPSASMAYGEATFICPNNAIMDAYARAGRGNASWSWRYNVWDGDNEAAGLGVPHVFDAPAVFGPSSVPSPQSYWTYNAPMVPLVMDYVLSFVRALDPNRHRLAGSPEWESWGAGAGQRRMVFELGTSHIESVAKGQQERCAFWKGIGKTLRQ